VTLTYEEKHSALWQKLKQHLGEEIQRLREKNDGQHDEVATAKLRGRIAALKELSALDADPIAVTGE